MTNKELIEILSRQEEDANVMLYIAYKNPACNGYAQCNVDEVQSVECSNGELFIRLYGEVVE